MLQFERFRLQIEAENYATHEKKTFGRDLILASGLNIIAGENTSGKSSLAKCFYYVLGMEQLIEGRLGAEALDDSVKKSFVTNRPDGKKDYWEVKRSVVYARMVNDYGEHIIIKRGITGQSTRTLKVKTIKGEDVETREFFLQGRGDHTPPNGFYYLLAQFAGLELQQVPSVGEGDVTLYMQIVFALSFIEQSRGWSDFFATMRTMNVFRPKQTLIEYALNILSDASLKNRRTLLDRKHELEDEWEKIMREVRSMTLMNDLIFVDEPSLKDRKQRIDSLNIGPKEGKGTIETWYHDLANRLQAALAVRQQASESSSERVVQYKKLKSEYDEITEKYQDFLGGYHSEKSKLSSVSYQIERLDEEIKTNSNLIQVSNLISSDQVETCPVCHQKMPVLHKHVNLALQQDDLKNNIEQLKTQRKFLESLKNRLMVTIEEKTIYLQYYEQLLKDQKLKLDQAYEEMGDDASMPSRVDLYNEVEIKLRLSRLEQIMEKKAQWESRLSLIYDEYLSVSSQYKNLRAAKKNAIDANLSKLENSFRTLADKFGYSSHGIYMLGLNMDSKSGYCYFPIVIEGDDSEEPVRPVSSSSDFVRCIWAYYLALLHEAKRHPGFLLMDEPCQQSMNELSMRQLFRHCSDNKDGQTILFCSSTPKVKGDNGTVDTRNIEDMLSSANLVEGEHYNINRIADHSVDVLVIEKK